MHKKYNKVAQMVRLAILFGASAATTMSTPVMSAEGGGEDVQQEIEKIQVTGSRLNRTDLESALPVTVISAQDIAATGLPDISAVLAQMPFNTQGSNVNRSNSSTANHSNSGLRGLGASRTLTLVNGKRVAPSATAGGSSTNLNLIPLEAVERIDILRDGAAAIYGSDAIGGVINIILKRDFEGVLLKLDAARPSSESGDESGISLTIGSTSDKGSSLIILEHKEDEGIRYGTRKVLSADFDLAYNRSSLYSPYGSYHTVDGDGAKNGPWNPGEDCPTEHLISRGDDGNRCGYPFLDGKNFTPKRQKDSIFGFFTYNIADNLTLETEVMALRDSAGTEASSVWTSGGVVIGADIPYNPTYGTDNPSDIRAYTRLVGVADRHTQFDSSTYHLGSTLSWELDSGILDFSFTASRQDINSTIEHYIFEDELKEAISSGNYNPFVLGGNATPETISNFLHTSSRVSYATTKSVGVTWASKLDFELKGGNIAYAVGGEWQDFTYKDTYDVQGAPDGRAFPTFGGNGGGERNYSAAFVEFDLPVLDDLNVKVASRYDKYSLPDVGQLSSSVNVRYQASDNLVLRGSYSQGFRAPSINDLLSETSISFNRVTDPLFCKTIGNDQSDDFCNGTGTQIERTSRGNKDLQPETSDQYAFGVVWDIYDNTSLTVDYYDIQINDQVQFLGAQDVVDLENAGLLGNFDNNAINVTRDENQMITAVLTGDINQVGTSTSGIDLDFKTSYEAGDFGTFHYSLVGSYTLEYETQATPTSERYDEVGSVTTPEYRFTTAVGYTIGEFSAQLTYRYIPSYSDLDVIEQIEEDKNVAEDPTFERSQGQKSWGILDFNSSYDFDNYGKIQLGVRNLADKEPIINTNFSRGFDNRNHNVNGRVFYGSYTVSF